MAVATTTSRLACVDVAEFVGIWKPGTLFSSIFNVSKPRSVKALSISLQIMLNSTMAAL
jgi:hypothetical protein